MPSRIIKITGIIAITLLAAFGGYYWYRWNTFEPQRDTTKALMEENVEFRRASTFSKNGEYDRAIEAYTALLDSTQKTDEKAVIEFRIAAAAFQKNWEEGVPLLKKVGTNEEYPAITRAYALQYPLWIYNGNTDARLLKLTLSGEPFESLTKDLASMNEKVIAANEYVSVLYPLGLTELRVANGLLTRIETANPGRYPLHPAAVANYENEKLRIKLALANADADMEKLKDSGAADLIPNVLLNKAVVLSRTIHLGILDINAGNPEDIYKDAYARIQIYSNAGTESFILYNYASYLNNQKERTLDAKNLVQKLSITAENAPVFKQFVRNNATLDSQNYDNLRSLALRDSSFKTFLNRNGWSLK